jgi:hypothetical protein
MTEATPTDRLTLYTVTANPAPREYEGGIYEVIVGVEHDGVQQRLTDTDTKATQTRAFDLPVKMGANTLHYFEEYYIDNPTRYRNCHIGAAAIVGAGHLEWVDALAIANDIMERGRQVDAEDVVVGSHGVIGVMLGEEPLAIHSVIGIAPGLAIQTTNENGDFTLASHPHNFAHYRRDGWQQEGEMYVRGDNH